jgi:hypothetical protein
MASKKLSAEERKELLALLKSRFEKNMKRHEGVQWRDVEARLEKAAGKLWSLSEMERTGGEPDIVLLNGDVVFIDCAAESPKGRRSICYDAEALAARKEHKPADSAVNMATAMGVELLSEDEYRLLQKLDAFDTKTSSWVKTPPRIRSLGGALFCDRRFDTVFVYHNGAESYYAGRAFRGVLKL